MDSGLLHVIAVVSNTRRFQSRYKLYREFEQRMLSSGVTLHVVEHAFGDRPFEVTTASNPLHTQVRGRSELWLKENLINIGASRLPADWKYMATIDADVEFVRPSWAQETIEALQHHEVVQPFSHVIDLGPNCEPIQYHVGFAYCARNGRTPGRDYEPFFHPGFGLAWRREAFDGVGGYPDRFILGACDHHVAMALLGKSDLSLPVGVTDEYKREVYRFQGRASLVVRGNVGYIPGAILHYFHGHKHNRRYIDRWQVLIDNRYNPESDVLKDSQGLVGLAGNKPKLRDDLMTYFAQRDEDNNGVPAFFGSAK